VKKARPRRRGRPAEFTTRARLQIFLEQHELKAIQAAAKRAGVSASRLARQAVLAAIR
jgi:hypothetical protein